MKLKRIKTTIRLYINTSTLPSYIKLFNGTNLIVIFEHILAKSILNEVGQFVSKLIYI